VPGTTAPETDVTALQSLMTDCPIVLRVTVLAAVAGAVHLAVIVIHRSLRLLIRQEITHRRFRIWPNRGQPIDASFVPGLCAELRKPGPDYQAWMITVTCEVEKKQAAVDSGPRWLWPPPRRRAGH
jgi:hypothetical protein